MSILNVTIDTRANPAITVKEQLAGGVTRSYFLKRRTLADYLMRGAAQEQVSLPWIDLLASNGVAVTRAGESTKIALTIPAGPRTLTYGTHGLEDTYLPLNLTLPEILWITTWNGERLATAHAYFCAGRVLSLTSTVRTTHAGVGNVQVDGGICWGSTDTSHLRVTNPKEVDSLFFGTRINEHLWNVGVPNPARPGANYRNLREWRNAQPGDQLFPDWTPTVRWTTATAGRLITGG